MRQFQLTLAAMWLAVTLPAIAQTKTPEPSPAASAASAVPLSRPGPRLLTPEQSRDNDTAPGEVRPERPVQPQISIPLKPAPTRQLGSAPGSDTRPGPAGGKVDDAAARCNAIVGTQSRTQCLQGLPAATPRPPA